MAQHVVARVGDIPPGERLIVDVGGREIGIFNVDGRFYALRNRCPHQGGPLCSGLVAGGLEATRPGEYTYDAERKLVRCPWHGWEFDLATGQSWFDPARLRVRSYPVAILPSAPGGSAPEGRPLEGPYVAETYPVTIEGDRVALELGND
jgi:3-phenylpropionate/trans-cinnamate dioxygenase ferredoxin subunit